MITTTLKPGCLVTHKVTQDVFLVISKMCYKCKPIYCYLHYHTRFASKDLVEIVWSKSELESEFDVI